MKTYKIIGKVEKRSRFDIFGIFEKAESLDDAAAKKLANDTAKDFAKGNNFSSYTVKSYGFEGGKFKVVVEVN